MGGTDKTKAVLGCIVYLRDFSTQYVFLRFNHRDCMKGYEEIETHLFAKYLWVFFFFPLS